MSRGRSHKVPVTMNNYKFTKGRGRIKVSLLAQYMGSDLVVFIYNENAHIGAVAVGEYDREERRASQSVIMRVGHRDDVVAQEAARSISKHTRKPVCVIVGIHLNQITDVEISDILENTRSLISGFIKEL